jgi:hypothetical protein
VATSKQIKKITAHDLAFGIGRKATFEELKNLIKETQDDTFISIVKFEKKVFKQSVKNNALTNSSK